ncbi:hypothetical protein AN958_09070 [Leucoagaricus sp. SymC.cos]|nr:hypothetical protein AN958_09070 [Leucoagaricus sp. SymC.cos]
MVKTLINSGCTHTCILEETVKELGIPLKPINRPFEVFNVDGSPSGNKLIIHYVDIALDNHGHKEQVEAVVTILDSAEIFLGHGWLIYQNSEIN